MLGEYAGRIAFSTDSYVVTPLFFPGGNIGDLAVHGTINDLAMRGARPIALSLALIIEEGFLFADLERIIASVGRASEEAGVAIVTGDTKVVPRGKADGLFINTTGIGIASHRHDMSGKKAQAGDAVLISGLCTVWSVPCSKTTPPGSMSSATRPGAAWPPPCARSPRPPGSRSPLRRSDYRSGPRSTPPAN